jgi:hypothetical protein
MTAMTTCSRFLTVIDKLLPRKTAKITVTVGEKTLFSVATDFIKMIAATFFLALQQLQNDRFSFFSVVTVKKMTAATCFSVATVTKLLL